MNAHVRRRTIHVGPAADLVAKEIAHRVLHFQRGELEALQRAFLRRDVDPYALLYGEVFRPGERPRRVVQVLLVPVGELAHAPKDARSDARPEVRPVADLPGSAERDPSGGLRRSLGAERHKLLEEQFLEPARTAREK